MSDIDEIAEDPPLAAAGPAGEVAPDAERTSARSLARAGFVVSGAYLVSRVLGYLRVLLLTTTFGAGHELDAFNAAFRIPDLIYQLVAAGAVASALVPIVGGLFATGEDQRAWRVVSTIANLMLLALAVLAAVAFVAAPWLVPTVIAPGFPEDVLAKTVDLTRLMLLAPILLALGAVVTSALNAERRFAASAVAPIIYNLAIIGAALFLSSSLGVTGLAVGVVVGSLGHLVIQLPSLLRAGFRYAPRIDLRDDAARRALVLMLPRVFGLGASQITIVVMVALASGFGSGAVTDWTNAFTLLQIPLGVIGIPLGIVLLPSLSRELAMGHTDVYLALIARSMRILLFVMLPIAGIGMALSYQAVNLLLDYGKVDDNAVALTASTLQLFLLGLGAHASIGVLARAFYARHDTRTPVLAAVLAVVINTTLAAVLVGRIGLPALGLAIAVAAWAEAIALLIVFKRREPGLDIRGIASVAARSLIATAVAAGIAFLVTESIQYPETTEEPHKIVILGEAALAAVAAGLAYIGVALALRISELPSMISIVTDLVRRRR
jgi:putative peptidoglycan lipid II flippase